MAEPGFKPRHGMCALNQANKQKQHTVLNAVAKPAEDAGGNETSITLSVYEQGGECQERFP